MREDLASLRSEWFSSEYVSFFFVVSLVCFFFLGLGRPGWS